jgi:TatD DNase family protein
VKFFDSHAHLTSSAVLPLLPAILERAEKAGVDHILNICTCRKTLEEGFKHKLLNAGATTPHDVEKDGEADFAIFEEAAKNNLLTAIGETGLDYHYHHSDRKIQQAFLIRYLHLAASAKLPVIFHCREAFEDLFSIVDQEYPKEAKAVLHCFTGTQKEAEGVLQRGWYLSLSGIVTFKKSESLREVANFAPLHQLLIETDTPYLSPQSKRGIQNEPAFIVETASCVAEMRKISLASIAKETRENAMRLFRLSN